jgi:hypothetical protein
MKDGQFHGLGSLYLTNGAELRGRWENGRLCQAEYVFSDGLIYDPKDPTYCTKKDRR